MKEDLATTSGKLIGSILQGPHGWALILGVFLVIAVLLKD